MSAGFRSGLARLRELGSVQRCAVMCAEAVWWRCHRRIIADYLLITGGQVFHDGLGLENVRRRFAYYPQQVWLYLLAAQWSLIGQEEAFVGRTSSVGDELGSRLITGRQVEFPFIKLNQAAALESNEEEESTDLIRPGHQLGHEEIRRRESREASRSANRVGSGKR